MLTLLYSVNADNMKHTSYPPDGKNSYQSTDFPFMNLTTEKHTYIPFFFS